MDDEIVARARSGDREAFAVLATDLATRYVGIARRILRDGGLAEDAAQQALLAIWQHLPTLRDPARFEGWAYRLLVRACHAEGRRARRQVENVRRLSASGPAAPAADGGGLGAVVDRDQLDRGFRRMTLEHRTIVVLYHYLDLPLDRIAEILAIPVGTAHSRLHAAMRTLRAGIDAEARTAPRGQLR